MKLSCLVLLGMLLLPGLMFPGTAAAQRSDDRAHFDARMNMLQRSLAELSARLEQINAQDRELEQRLQRMRENIDQRLERLERPAPRAQPRR